MNQDALFSHPADDAQQRAHESYFRPGAGAPLAARMRPRELSEVVGQDHVLGPDKPLTRLINGTGEASVILYGPPGTGKTTIASLVSQHTGRKFVALSALDSGVKELRGVIDEAKRSLARGQATVLFIDEIHRFSKTQQDALLAAVENRIVLLVAATTENPSFAVVAPLLSRSLVVQLHSLGEEAIKKVIARAIAHPDGLAERVAITPDAASQLARLAGGDARRALTYLEAAAEAVLTQGAEQSGSSAGDSADEQAEPDAGSDMEESEPTGDSVVPGLPTITVSVIEHTVSTAVVRYDRAGDEHYDVTSALIKSIRGSDVDAALHYLARQIRGGEDPRFLARRLVILASEDIGLADPNALVQATAAAQAVQMIGLPEARINLAQAVVYLALAPKSNRVYQAIDAAIADIDRGVGGPIPPALRDAHYAGAKKLGSGKGYRYPHDDSRGVVAQDYAPEAVRAARYYHPTDHGEEKRFSRVLETLRRIVRGQ